MSQNDHREAAYLGDLTCIVGVHVEAVNSIVEHLELQQVLMKRVLLAHPILLTDEAEK